MKRNKEFMSAIVDLAQKLDIKPLEMVANMYILIGYIHLANDISVKIHNDMIDNTKEFYADLWLNHHADTKNAS